MIAFGLGVLRLSPDAFWRMSLPELRAALDGLTGRIGVAAPPGRADLDLLMRRFPDAGLRPRKEPHE